MLNPTFQLILVTLFNSFGDICDGKEAIQNLAKIVETTFYCDKNINSLVITGDYIKFSEFTNDNGELKEICTSEFGLKSVRIFATDKVTLDNDFWMAGIEMIVIAPIWNITRSIEINLNGQKPEDPQPTPSKKEVIGQKGVDGEPGQSGHFGGNFVGMGGEFINGGSLTVSVSGGNGQSGGDGGDGGDGQDGLYPKLSSVSITCYHVGCTEQGTEIAAENNLGRAHIFRCILEIFEEYTMSHKCWYRVKGEKGRSSGNGGNSGAGGMPGNAGNILFLGVEPNIKQINSKGKAGKDGMPGKAGKPGSNGQDVLYALESWLLKYNMLKHEYEYNNNLSNGIDGKIDRTDLKQAMPSKALDLSEIANIVVEYRGLMVENLDLSDNDDFRVQFYYSIEKNKHIMSIFDTLALVNEMKHLEKRFHKLHKSLNFLPLYQSLLNRTVEYARKLNSQPQRSFEHKKVLTYLYTTILGREYNLKDRSESNLIVNIGSYLDQVKDSILKYKESNRIHTIGKASENFKKNIDLKVQEANDAINNAILPELHDALMENEHNVDAVVKEIIKLEEESKENIQKKAKAKVQYRDGINLMMALDMVRFIGRAASLVPDVGASIAWAVEEGANIVEDAFEIDRNPTVHPTKKLPKGALNSRAYFEGEKSRYLDETREMIKLLIKVLTDDRGSNNRELISELEGFDEKLNLVRGIKDIEQLRKEMSEVLKKANNNNYFKEISKRSLTLSSYPFLLEQEQSFEIGQTRIQKRFLADVHDCDHKNSSRAEKQMLLLLALTGSAWPLIINVYRRSKDHHMTVLKNLCEAVVQEFEYFSKIEDYKNFIRNDVGPSLELVSEDVLKASKSLGSKSRVSLVVTKLQIQSKLKDMQAGVLSVVQGLNNVPELFKNTFSKVNDAINTLINMFDRIQSYQEEQNWANHMAILSSAGSKSIEINDEKLSSAIDYLNVVLNSNTVIQQYQTAVDSFKQFVFPFADLYFKELILPHNLNYGEELDELVVKAETQVDHMKKKLDQYRSTAKKIDSYLGTGQFNSRYRSTKPFFVWEYKIYSKMISALLSGKKVLLFADVRKSMSRYDAVKFTEMEFNFKFSDKKTQSVVNNILKSFVISAFHMGNSYFRTDDQYFLLTTGPLDFGYNLEKDRNGIPLSMSNVHGKVKTGDAMLSPYATWSLQLSHISEMNPQVFKAFDKYKKQIQLELIGRGHFLYKDKLDVDIKLDLYYTPLYKRNETKP